MDLDGPQNDKGLYAIAAVAPRTIIGSQDVISWSSFKEQPGGQMRVGFMSQISPDGQYVVTTVGAEKDIARNYYVANFKDYRFLQVFYRDTRNPGGLQPCDRPPCSRCRARTTAVRADQRRVEPGWQVPGVRARRGQGSLSPGRALAMFANDPAETQVQYDLYRIPFNGGRGGTPEPIAGASRNGMSNSFPKVSPDGRWIVFVQARNGLLMRPDSQLYIVPARGGTGAPHALQHDADELLAQFLAQRALAGLLFEGRSPYTQMYLTHIDEEGRDSPAILVENATAANRAVNIPEFVNIPQDGLRKIETPAADFYHLFDRAWELGRQGQHAGAADLWRQVLAIDPDDAKANNNMGFVLANLGRVDEAIAHWRKALAADSEYAEVHRNLARALSGSGRFAESVPHWRKTVELEPGDAEARYNFGVVLLRQGDTRGAVEQFRAALALQPADAQTHNDLGVALLSKSSTTRQLPSSSGPSPWPRSLRKPASTWGVRSICWAGPPMRWRNGAGASLWNRITLRRCAAPPGFLPAAPTTRCATAPRPWSLAPGPSNWPASRTRRRWTFWPRRTRRPDAFRMPGRRLGAPWRSPDGRAMRPSPPQFETGWCFTRARLRSGKSQCRGDDDWCRPRYRGACSSSARSIAVCRSACARSPLSR